MARPLVVIACQSIDFFGDAAVCLRLAQGLLARGAQVRVLADARALQQLKAMQPDCAEEGVDGFVPGKALGYWAFQTLAQPGHGLPVHRADLFLEAFQLQPPRVVLSQLAQSTARYLVDYLAMEDWTSDCQGLRAPDPQSAHMTRVWLAPSLRPDGPGLIQGNRAEALAEWSQVQRQAVRRSMVGDCDEAAVLLVFAYCYPDVQLLDFQRVLDQALAEVKRDFMDTVDTETRRDLARFERVVVFEPSPTLDSRLLSQQAFDQCMAAADLALVRGEDSLGSALFCASRFRLPFAWQPYRQEAGAHLQKLDAWLAQSSQHASEDPIRQGWSALHHGLSPDSLAPASTMDWLPTLRLLLLHWRAFRDFCQSVGLAHYKQPSFEESLLRHWSGTAQDSR